jgi:dTDP-4-amino-4,6-dideoxygalactose transaminase
MVPYEDLKLVNKPFTECFRQQFENLLSSGWYILGDQVRRFENDFASYHHLPHCIGVANGLDALILSLKALQLKEGSEVLVPSNTYIATILAIIHNGHVPVLVEPDIHTYNIDPGKIEDLITKKTAAVLVVHLYGKCCKMDEIMDICRRHGLALIEDCAQSHGAKYKGQLCGTFGDMAAFSFYPTKNLGCLGDGGAVLTKDDKLADPVRMLRNYGSSEKYRNKYVGYNSRLDELQAAFLQVKLKSLATINAHKKQLASIYINQLREDFIRPSIDRDHDDVYHIFTVRHSKRDELRKHLAAHGIGTEVHYPVPPHRQEALNNIFANNSYPVSEQIHQTILSLPCSTAHSVEDVQRVVTVMNEFRA